MAKKIGLALGAGAARGLVHIGVLKVLHKNKIYPDYIAGTSMGAVIGAGYAVGHTPEQMEQIAKTTDWKNIVDFTIPKSGLIKGEIMEKKLGKLFENKQFKQSNIPLSVVAYNFTKRKQVVFTKGNIAKAVRASISIPGIIAPTIINNEHYIDGVVTNPTPYDIVRDMGADIIIAVDLYNRERKVSGPTVKQGSLLEELRRKFIMDELFNVKNYIFPQRWPKFIQKLLNWTFDKLLYPAKILRIMIGRELPEITKVMYESFNILANSFALERIKNADIDIKLMPKFSKLTWTDFDKVDQFVAIGEKSMKYHLPELKKKLRRK